MWLSLLLFSSSVVKLFVTPWTAAHQASLSFTISWSLLKLMSIESVMPSNHLILCSPLLFLPSILPHIVSFPMSQLFASGDQSIGASASASVLPMNIQGWFPLGLTGLIPLIPRDSQESSPASQLKNINSSSPRLFYGPALTSVHDCWKNHSFNYMDLYQKSDVSAFYYAVWVCHNFSSKEQVSFNFMVLITVHSDFGAQENKVCHCFCCLAIYLPWSDGTRCHDLSFLNVEF